MLARIGGFGGSPGAAPPGPVYPVFADTSPVRRVLYQIGDYWLSAIIFPYDPTGMGAFLATSPGRRVYGVESMVVKMAIPPLANVVELRKFIAPVVNYQFPWRQGVSVVNVLIPISVFFTFDIKRWLEVPIAWRSTRGYPWASASLIVTPQGPNPIPLPSGKHNIWPQMHRRKLLFGKLW
jgi:hypothetical protein